MYAIKNWNAIFENNRSRQLDEPTYVNWPVRRDSEGFASLMRDAKGMAAFGLFGALVQWFGRQPTATRRRGVLADDKGPMTPERFAVRTGAPLRDVRSAWDRLVSVGWLSSDVQVTPECPATDAVVTEERPRGDGEVTALCAGEERRGGEGRGERQRGVVSASPKATSKLTAAEAKEHPTPMGWSPDTRAAWEAWVESRYANGKPMTKRALDMALAKLGEWPPPKVLAALRDAAVGGWQGIYEPKANGKGSDVRGTRKHEVVGDGDENIDIPIYRQTPPGGVPRAASGY